MIFGLFTLAVAIIISAVSAYYSITGLTAIFTGAFWSIVIMGGALELGKITATVWLHKYWNKASWQFKTYLVPAIVILMLITSMGTFGYLSAAHLSQSTATDDISAQVSLLDDKIKTEKDNIDADKRALQQMDAQVDQMLGRTTDDRGANRAVQIRKQQSKERKSLQDDIAKSQKTITSLQAERAPIAAKSRVAESHIGPIKYIAALIYGDNPNADLLERAVRWVIILLVFVFDPLALILILAAEQTIEWVRSDKKKKNLEDQQREGWHQEWVPDSENPWHDDEPLTDEQLAAIKESSGVDRDLPVATTVFATEEEFFAHGKEIAHEFDQQAEEDQLPNDYASTSAYLNKPWVWFPSKPKLPEEDENSVLAKDLTDDEFLDKLGEDLLYEDYTSTQAYLKTPQTQSTSNAEDITKFADAGDLANALNLIETLESKNAELTTKIAALESAPLTDHVGNAITTAKQEQVVAPDLSINADYLNSNVTAGFGTVFPMDPNKGDIYLRVDYLPSKLFKWNGTKWIEIEKNSTDRYSYDEEYIKHLIEKIAAGNYDTDLLTPAEQEQIQRYLNDSDNQ